MGLDYRPCNTRTHFSCVPIREAKQLHRDFHLNAWIRFSMSATRVHASHQYSICGEHQRSELSELDREADAARQHSTKFHHHRCGYSDSDVDLCFARAIFGQDCPLV